MTKVRGARARRLELGQEAASVTSASWFGPGIPFLLCISTPLSRACEAFFQEIECHVRGLWKKCDTRCYETLSRRPGDSQDSEKLQSVESSAEASNLSGDVD